MKTIYLIIFILVFVLSTGEISRAQHQHQHGKVDFKVSCNPPAQESFSSGLAILHHMMYEQAEEQFKAALEADPNCAMAHWGIAMTVIHPLWGERPSDEALKKGQKAIADAKNISSVTEGERNWIDAVEPFFVSWETTSYPDQLIAFKKGYEKLYQTYPDDIEAAAFYGLGELAIAPKNDPEFTSQARIGSMLEEFHKQAPDHPGLFHYTIHAYDNPVLAPRAIDVARGYDKIAPDVPHALHMPSHIFVRVGLWDDVIAWNRRSADSAWKQPVGDQTSMHYAHALDYLVYAALQQGEDMHAQKALQELNNVTNFQQSFATAYAVAASQVRYLLEREAWTEAARLPVTPPNGFPVEKWGAAESMLYYGRGLGAVRAGETHGAREAIDELNKMYDKLNAAGETYWAVLTDAQRTTVEAWLALSEGESEQALQLMREAADKEDSVDKHPVTPGHVMPARELLGDMLLEIGSHQEALIEYQKSLEYAANRFRSLYGAGRAAELSGNKELAIEYYNKLVSNVSDPQNERPQVKQIQEFLAVNR